MAQTNNIENEKKNTLQGLFQLAGRIIRLEPGESAFKNEMSRDTEFLGYESFCTVSMDIIDSATPKSPDKKA